MRGLLNFIFDAIKRSVGATIVGAVLLAMGVDRSSYVLVILGLWCIASVFYRQTQAEIEKIRNPKFNVSVPEITKYLREESAWGVVENRHSSISSQAATLKINQEVRDGPIQLDGRRQIDQSMQTVLRERP